MNQLPKFKLKYLFFVEYTDGTAYQQTPDDTSKVDASRSEFFDVLNSGKEIARFSIISVENKKVWATVNLETGLFNVGGINVLLESQKLPALPQKFELVYYRQRTENLNATYNTKTGNLISTEEQESFCEYFIGWKCTLGGKEYTQKLALS